MEKKLSSSIKSRVDDRLHRIANFLLLNASFTDNLGLLNGKMGISVFFFHYSRHTNSKIFEDYAGELIDEIYEEINTNSPVDFANGLTGIGWGIEYLAENKFVEPDTDQALSEIDRVVYRNSIYTPFLLGNENDFFGHGLYFLARLRENGDDDNNIDTLFKKQHLIYLTDECERILVEKKFVDNNIQSLNIDSINSFILFLLEIDRLELFPVKIEKILHSNNGGGQIAFLAKSDKSGTTYYDSYNNKKKIGWEDYLKSCSGAVLLINPHKNSGEKDYRKKWQDEILGRSVLPGSITILVLFVFIIIVQFFNGSYIYQQPVIYLLFLTKISGIVFSSALALHEFEINVPLTEKLCHLNKFTNCNTVLNDSASKIFSWIGWSDVGMIYFLSTFLILLQGLAFQSIFLLAVTALLALPYTLFSIWYQGMVLKKWCPFCLGVQLILITEFILFLPRLRVPEVSFVSITTYFISFLTIALVYILLLMYIREKKSRELLQSKNLKFKTNPDILQALLIRQKHFRIPCTDLSLVFGPSEADLNVTVFLSLHCSHCARAFNKIENILESGYKAKIQIVLVTSDQKIINTLYHLNRNGRNSEALSMLNGWYNADPYSRHTFSDNYCLPEAEDISNEVGNANTKLFKDCEVIGTPAFFINGYKLPNQYDIEDIKYLSEVFKKKEMFN